MYCKFCGKEMKEGTSYCYNCEKFQDVEYDSPKISGGRKPIFKRWWFWGIVAVLVFAVIGSGKDNNNNASTDSPAVGTITTPETLSMPDETVPLVENDNISLGEKNALRSALNYLDFSAFSYDGLIDQLEFEGYSTAEALYAVNNCGADWNEQALLCALNYLDYTAFSYTGLIDQLEFGGFTTAEATYGANNCGADWNEQAAKCAEDYLEYSAFSRQGLIDQLLFEGFTQSQAEYGARAVGY